MNIELCWMASMSASCFYTVAELAFGREVDPELADILAEPTRALAEEIEYAGLPADRFWRQLTALAAEIDGNRQLAEVAVAKTVGFNERFSSAIGLLATRISEIESAMLHQRPKMIDSLTEWSAPLRSAWEVRGEGLLAEVARVTDARLIVPRADVVLVYPTASGGGTANLEYNSVCLEAVKEDPLPELPEVVRLAWLLSQLNIDLPIFSERVSRDRLPLLASAAMLPPALVAAEDLGLAHWDRPTAGASLRAATPEVHQPDAVVEVLFDWWETYEQSRPTFDVALAALERMVQEATEGEPSASCQPAG